MTVQLLQRLKHWVWQRRTSQLPAPRSVFTAQLPEYSRYSIGTRTYGCPEILEWQPDVKLTIGSYCSIASGVQIMLGGEHNTSWVTTYPFAELIPSAAAAALIGYSKGDVNIGSDVWIGHNALILSGVNIGSGAIIGAGSLVTKDIEPYEIVAGNPARFIRHRIPKELIPTMMTIQWWNWPEDLIVKSLPLLLSSKLEEFIKVAQTVGQCQSTIRS